MVGVDWLIIAVRLLAAAMLLTLKEMMMDAGCEALSHCVIAAKTAVCFTRVSGEKAGIPRCHLRAITGKSQIEHKFSALALKADISR
jgi:hypothetical protein